MRSLAALAAAAIWSAACSSSSPPAGQTGTGGTPGSGGAPGGQVGSGGTGGASCPAASASVSCTPDLAWYVMGDSGPQPLTPDATSGAFCTSGAAAQDSSGAWGGGLAVDFNAAGNNGTSKGIWDASSYGGVAFDFSGSMIPSHGLRVSFAFAGQGPAGAPTYQGTAQPYSTLSDGTHVVIHWDAVGGPYGTTAPVLFDPSKLQTMQIQVLSSATGPTPYQFCVANLTALPD